MASGHSVLTTGGQVADALSEQCRQVDREATDGEINKHEEKEEGKHSKYEREETRINKEKKKSKEVTKKKLKKKMQEKNKHNNGRVRGEG